MHWRLLICLPGLVLGAFACTDKSTPIVSGPARQLAPDDHARFQEGAKLYRGYCVTCHLIDGRGKTGIPTLVGSPRVLGPPDLLARLLVRGATGPWESGGRRYNQYMPPLPVPLLKGDRLASILTYVRQAFGNDAEPVDPAVAARATVGRSHEGPWTHAEFLAEERRHEQAQDPAGSASK